MSKSANQPNYQDSVDEYVVSRITGLSVHTLRNYRHLGKGPPYIKIGRAVRYSTDRVMKWLESLTVEPRE